MERDIEIGSILRGKQSGRLALVLDVDPYGFITLQFVDDTSQSRRVYKHNLSGFWEVVV